mmetsp:Transcript_47194/g.110272  ORF Transcript_47194/g.110272 Transcript_47194/m.110272 type:complete len:272 (+) Transcript_47194:512-1327(+)
MEPLGVDLLAAHVHQAVGNLLHAVLVPKRAGFCKLHRHELHGQSTTTRRAELLPKGGMRLLHQKPGVVALLLCVGRQTNHDQKHAVRGILRDQVRELQLRDLGDALRSIHRGLRVGETLLRALAAHARDLPVSGRTGTSKAGTLRVSFDQQLLQPHLGVPLQVWRGEVGMRKAGLQRGQVFEHVLHARRVDGEGGFRGPLRRADLKSLRQLADPIQLQGRLLQLLRGLLAKALLLRCQRHSANLLPMHLADDERVVHVLALEIQERPLLVP